MCRERNREGDYVRPCSKRIMRGEELSRPGRANPSTPAAPEASSRMSAHVYTGGLVRTVLPCSDGYPSAFNTLKHNTSSVSRGRPQNGHEDAQRPRRERPTLNL